MAGRTEDETRVEVVSAEMYTGGGVLRIAEERTPVTTSVSDGVVQLCEKTEEVQETGGSTDSTLTAFG